MITPSIGDLSSTAVRAFIAAIWACKPFIDLLLDLRLLADGLQGLVDGRLRQFLAGELIAPCSASA